MKNMIINSLNIIFLALIFAACQSSSSAPKVESSAGNVINEEDMELLSEELINLQLEYIKTSTIRPQYIQDGAYELAWVLADKEARPFGSTYVANKSYQYNKRFDQSDYNNVPNHYPTLRIALSGLA